MTPSFLTFADNQKMECGICLEKFTKRRKRIECPYCPADAEMSACIVCVKTYLAQDDAHTPRCPCCRSGWTEDFLSQTFPTTWLLREYKAHREHILLDTERARLPEAQEDANRYRRALATLAEFQARIRPIEAEMNAAPEVQAEKNAFEAYRTAWRERMAEESRTGPNEELRNTEHRLYLQHIQSLSRATATKRLFLARIAEIKTEEYRRAANLRDSVGSVPVTTETERRNHWSFVMKCGREECQGFVGMNWKCGLCEVEFCRECGEHKGVEAHYCNGEVLSNFQAMRKEAKPCPKCAAMISKIDGCDQMWCTQCQTAFSWRSGQIETSHVHNPHYFQWMRQNGGAPRPVGNCLELEPRELVNQVIHYALQRHTHSIVDWARFMWHYHWVLGRHRRTLQSKQTDNWRRELRVKRLVNEITDDQWKDKLQRGEKATQKEYAIVQVLELFYQAGIDILRESIPDTADIPGILEQMEALRNYCNEEMQKIQKRYKNEVEYITNPLHPI